jgi:hypothetical protein
MAQGVSGTKLAPIELTGYLSSNKNYISPKLREQREKEAEA